MLRALNGDIILVKLDAELWVKKKEKEHSLQATDQDKEPLTQAAIGQRGAVMRLQSIQHTHTLRKIHRHLPKQQRDLFLQTSVFMWVAKKTALM